MEDTGTGMPEKMRAVVKTSAAPGAELTMVDVPRAGPGEVLVKIKATSICGTDIHIYEWDPWAASRIKPPMIFLQPHIQINQVGKVIFPHLQGSRMLFP